MSNETEWVLVKRDDLLRWAEDFARDNDPGDDTDIVTPFDDYLLQPPSAPVGVEGLVVKWKKESESLDIHPAGLAARRVCAIELEQALAQQPAAVGEADAGDAEIEALRAEVAAWRELSDHVRAGACNAIWPDRYTDARTSDVAAALKRAERLAEALRGLLALPIAEAELRHLDKGIGTATRNAAWLRARAALRDHDQEGGNP